MKKFIYQIVGFIATYIWWPFWSNIRWKKAIKKNIPLREEDKVVNIHEIQPLLCEIMKHFKWTADGFTELWDSMTPPPQNYQYYVDGLLKDDCDGFHAVVYHCLVNCGFECYLLAVETYGSGHCVLLMRDGELWHVIDYTHIYNGFSDPQEAIDNYNIQYQKIYNTKNPVYFNGLIKYDYEKGKFEGVFVKNLKKN